ncbi:MobA/MobL family protein [Fannyhessea vaginae]|uniref:MobA/MobL family protein n=1 Tax=Fannyhessea vaginae TaxID=82135 RepID=UPI003A801B4F
MAIYHMSISNVSRAKGSSACASLAYIAASKVYEERTQQTYSYGRAERVMKVATLLPDGASAAYADAAQLFNSIENYEQSANARTAKKIVVALPRELSLDTSDEILTDFIRGNLCAHGYCATYAIHTDKEGNNPHAHILVANRQINKKGQWSSKRKMEYVLDEKGERIPLIDKKTGKQKVDKRNRKQWKRVSAEQNPLDKKQFLEQLRESWAEECNKHLSQEDRIDHRSNAARGIDDIPTIHEGYAARAMEARGDVSERMEINRQIRLKNDLIHQLIETLKEIRDKVLNTNIERLAKHDHENGWVSQIYATAKKWLTHNRTHEVVAPPTPPTTPPDKPPTPRVPDKKELPVVPTAPAPVVQQVPPMRSLADELAAAKAAANKQKQVTAPPTHGLSHRR